MLHQEGEGSDKDSCPWFGSWVAFVFQEWQRVEAIFQFLWHTARHTERAIERTVGDTAAIATVYIVRHLMLRNRA